MTFSYVAMDAKGQEKKGTVEADNQMDAVSKVRASGVFPVSIVEQGAQLDGSMSDGPNPEAEMGGTTADTQDAMSVAIGLMVDSCGSMLAGLLRNGFLRSEAIELVKVFLAKAVETGIVAGREG